MSELIPCPFCGWEFAEHAWNEFGEEYRVCDQCGASSGTVDSKWDWQSRPIEDELRKRIAELGLELGRKSVELGELVGRNIIWEVINDELKSRRENLERENDRLQEKVSDLLKRIAELEADKELLNSCESALISMVNQFFYSKAGENIFRHSFMSAEEEAAEYLVEHGIARWVGKNKSAICFNEVQE